MKDTSHKIKENSKTNKMSEPNMNKSVSSESKMNKMLKTK